MKRTLREWGTQQITYRVQCRFEVDPTGLGIRLEARKKPTDRRKHTTSNRDVVHEYACGLMTLAEKRIRVESIQRLARQGIPTTNTGCYKFFCHVGTPPRVAYTMLTTIARLFCSCQMVKRGNFGLGL